MIKTEDQSFLTFSFGGLKFAVNALSVKEIFYLPELTPVEEMPDYIAGVMNLRGKIIPVMDLNIRFGRLQKPYSLTDRVITLITEEDYPIGIIVNEVNDFLNIPMTSIEPPPVFGHDKDCFVSFIASLAKLESGILMILKLDRLTDRLSDFSGVTAHLVTHEETACKTGDTPVFCFGITPEELTAFRERSRNLMAAPADETLAESIPVAVVGISGEYYGIEISYVQEFAMIHGVTPVPCCPGHIIGNMNLRGNVLTLIDIRGIFDLPLSDGASEVKAIVISNGDLTLGLAVDDILDIVHIHPSEMVQSPSGLREGKEKYIRGTASYGDRVMSVIHISKMLSEGELTVNEEI
ncbi:MAG: chemotaxis protein CheW [Desulfobacteraceae bacterium]